MKPQYVVVPVDTFLDMWYILGFAEALIDDAKRRECADIDERIRILNKKLKQAYANASDDL